MTGIMESTVYLSVTAIIILLFKWIFKNKLSAKWHVLIWVLLAVRLVLPSLPESSFSIFNAFDIPAVQENVQEIVRENDTVLPNADYEVNDNPVKVDNPTRPSNADTIDVTDLQINHISEADSNVENEKAEKTSDVESIAGWIVYAGSFLLFLYFIVIYIVCISKNFGKPRANDGETAALLEECKKIVGVKRRVYIVNDGETPMLMGLVKPTIILPDGYTVSEKKDILIHELCHLKSGDIYLLWLAMIVLCLNWYNPIVWICFFTFRRDVEVYCDERVLKYVDSKKDYAALLVKTALKKNSFVAGTTSLQNGEKEVEQRVKHMAYFKKPHYVWTIAIALIAVVIGVLCLTNPKANESVNKDNDTQKAAEIYNLFLENKAKANINNSEYSLTQYIERNSAAGMKLEYTFFDMNDDGISELHLKSPRSYDIFTVKGGKIELWYEGSPYENFTSDGNIFYCRYGGAPNNRKYIFKEPDFDGNVVSEVSWSVYNLDDSGSITPDAVFYNGDGEEISKDEYYDYINKYDKVPYDYDWFVFYDNLETVIWENIDEETKTNITIQYPAVFGMQDLELQEKINKTIKEAALERYYDYSSDLFKDGFDNTSWPVAYTVAHYGDRFISIYFEGYIYTMGCAHGSDTCWTVNVDLSTGERIKLGDVFDDIFCKYITSENFGNGAFADAEAFEKLFGTDKEYLEANFTSESDDNFFFGDNEFGINLYMYSDYYNYFTTDYESLKDCMKDHPIWQELVIKPYDYSEVYGKDGKVMESSKNFYLEDRTDKYYFEVYGNDGSVLWAGLSEKCPVFIHLDGSIYELRHSYGTFEWKSNFFDVEQGTNSELFDRPFHLANTVIARVNSVDVYDESLTNKTGMHTNIVLFDVSKEHLENIVHSVSADFLNESTSWIIEYIDDTHICVTYYTENGKQENKKVLEVPSLTKEFSLTFNGFTFDCDTTVEEITSFFPTSDRWEEPENYSFIAGSPTAKRISFAYPDHKAPKVRVICIENLETGHSFIERIIVYDEKVVSVTGEENVNYYKEEYGYGTVYDISIDTPESRTIDLYQKEILAEISESEETKQPTEQAQNNSKLENVDESVVGKDNAVIESETAQEKADIPLKEQEEMSEETAEETTSVPDTSDTVTDETAEEISDEAEVLEPDNEITISYESIW